MYYTHTQEVNITNQSAVCVVDVDVSALTRLRLFFLHKTIFTASCTCYYGC